MGRPKAVEEIKGLEAKGLRIDDTTGDGNCLFRSLSTTLYGHDGEYRSIRAKVVNYIGDHANEYMMFIPYNPGGGLRRNPKRKTTGAYSAPDTAPTAAERRTYFDRYVAKMAEEGTYATEVEIVAFTKAFDRSVVVYHYAGNEIPYTAGGGSRPTSHVAYHNFDHYSAVRNIAGPATGLPMVKPIRGAPGGTGPSVREDFAPPQWQIDVVKRSLSNLDCPDDSTISRCLTKHGGDVNGAVSELLASLDSSSSSNPASGASSQGRNSIERDANDTDLNEPGAKRAKKLDDSLGRELSEKLMAKAVKIRKISRLRSKKETDTTGKKGLPKIKLSSPKRPGLAQSSDEESSTVSRNSRSSAETSQDSASTQTTLPTADLITTDSPTMDIPGQKSPKVLTTNPPSSKEAIHACEQLHTANSPSNEPGHSRSDLLHTDIATSRSPNHSASKELHNANFLSNEPGHSRSDLLHTDTETSKSANHSASMQLHTANVISKGKPSHSHPDNLNIDEKSSKSPDHSTLKEDENTAITTPQDESGHSIPKTLITDATTLKIPDHSTLDEDLNNGAAVLQEAQKKSSQHRRTPSPPREKSRSRSPGETETKLKKAVVRKHLLTAAQKKDLAKKDQKTKAKARKKGASS